MTTIKAGDLWIANIQFSTGTGSKKRPVLILWLDGDDVITAAITSAQPRTRTDVILDNWFESGLRVESTLRLSRLVCLEKSLLQAKVGKISETDAQNLKNIWDMYIKPEF
ncbi:hypothetical protein DSM106972_006190 [Dulcicalothrix desertica PCC 7102]|uniref:mRNA interferase PemK n=1 Tax=Dulcicalothrix desertica PCC 7102 TaxID=232991 RepID=A0A3S1DHS2_9CYAN|nr:type II toxin-antitoxin system PemK/MazF family toxin [Dulcicalothrix desertica]RUT10124.1 hypothetical protein DSM106972_006190 [Dulcicalothrix desertica PCC 7102]TWH40898.1 mRNA interferase MazF [Dulcicalothrix desertica PCC 7102]